MQASGESSEKQAGGESARPVSLGEFKEMLEALRGSEERFRLLVESVRDYAIFMLDPDGRITSWNQGAEHIKGYLAGEILGQHFSRFYPPEDVASGKPDLELKVAAEQGRLEDEGWRVRKDGSRFWANVIITALRDEAGILRGFAKVTRDISARHQHEERLRESEERFRLLVEGVKDYAIFRLDPDGRVATWNAGAERAKGYRADEIIGQHFSRFYTPEDQARGKPAWVLQQAREHGRFEDEGWRVRKDGSRFWADVVVTALYDSAGVLRGFAKVTRDITDKRQAELDRQHLAVAQEALRAREEFLSIAGHELKTPLTSLQLQIQSLAGLISKRGARALDPDRVGRMLKVAHRQVQRLTGLVHSLLDVSRITAGRLALEPQEVELSGLVRDVCARFADEAASLGCVVSVEAPAAVTGRWDPLRVDQIVTNLLSNALKYGAGKPIEIRVEQEGPVARLAVRDRGIGISLDDRDRLFGRFERLVSSREYGGFGLGLWISRQMVEAHGGTIAVDSAPGQGSTFTVEIPVAGPPGR